MQEKKGSFVVSLDFELMWGKRDNATKESYGKNIIGVHTALPKILEMFSLYNIHGTWATAGLLFFKNKAEMLADLPALQPSYTDKNLSPYGQYLQTEVEDQDQYHFGLPLLEKIKATANQEISTHTFSHYYCLEDGQTLAQFQSDITAAISIAGKRGIKIKSIIFPRNQFNKEYLKVCSDAGIDSYRNTERSWMYRARKNESESLARRFFRLLDAYINLSGHNCYSDEYMGKAYPYNIPSSRFLRPFSAKIKVLDHLRLKRITNGMTHAAKNNLTYHLWWHPHNFGINQNENLAFLEKILKHHEGLNQKYQFSSCTMDEVAIRLKQHYGK